ncbi:MAG: hypothetical protein HQ518_11135 [Rhodopirellula sp.]|nr:hypothetical protein [Rhodopirellula sp.]
MSPGLVADDVVPALTIDSPMSPPTWALLQRKLLQANADACEEFYRRYFDERGFLLCVERWGGDDGPDDAIENCHRWPILHALGADDRILQLYKQAWEGHLRQYTLARTTHVPFARDGMYYREFPVMFDWLHHAEGLTVFCLQGLSDPHDRNLLLRTQRFAGFYLNDNPQAQNYDSKHRLIKSMFNGSRGPLLRPATGLDWAGDPIEIEHRFELGHGERNYEEMLAHFKDYNDIVGDHPQNLLSTALGLNAFMLTGETRYRDWVLEYADAWRQRMVDNGNIIPTKIGLDGKTGGPDGKWYGGVYGWGFSIEVPQTGELAHRNTHYLGLPSFMNAYLLTGEDRFLDPWRKQIDVINAQAKTIDGKQQYPRMFGDDGWYSYSTAKYTTGVEEIAFLTQQKADLARVPKTGWWSYLEGKNPDYPKQALRADLAAVRKKVLASREDTTTPDTRLADDPMKFNPASIASLVQQMLGGLPTNKQGLVLHSRLRYFDPVNRRAGLPSGCTALVEKLEPDSTTVTLVNTDQLNSKTVTIQAGGYGEHQFTSGETRRAPPVSRPASGRADTSRQSFEINSRTLTLKLEPGCGVQLVLGTSRYVNPPTLAFPWNRAK